MYACVH
ncbi:hypothetical protein BIW11_04661, partial [Tropilaelaps mercedesae]